MSKTIFRKIISDVSYRVEVIERLQNIFPIFPITEIFKIRLIATDIK